MLNNYQYNLKVGRLIVLVPNQQYMMRRNIDKNLSQLIDMNLKVSLYLYFYFLSNLDICPDRTALCVLQMLAILVKTMDLQK